MDEMQQGNEEPLGVTDGHASDTYLRQLHDLEADALGNPSQSRVLLLTATKLWRLGKRIEAHIATEWDEAPPAEAFKRTQAPIEALLKLTRQAERYVRLSNDLQRSEQGKYPGQPR